MRWLGQMQRAFELMCAYALERETSSGPLADKQTVQNWIADSAAEMQAARLMTLHAAWVMDTQGARAAAVDISLIKFYGARVLHDVVDRALQVHGSLGYSTDMPLEQMYRFARGARFYDGPDEVHRQTVARRILAGYAPPPGELPSEHLPTRRERARPAGAARPREGAFRRRARPRSRASPSTTSRAAPTSGRAGRRRPRSSAARLRSAGGR
jgi:acyl-CoA dehydrogenase